MARFLRTVERGRFDVIHSQHPALSAAVAIARKTSPEHREPPVVTSGHGTGLPEADADGFVSIRQSLRVANSRLMLPVDRAAFRASAKVISVSEFQREELAHLYKISAERTSVIYNGVDLTRYRPDTAPSSSIPVGPDVGSPLILFVGRLVPKKGLQYLIRAFPQILETFPRAHCVVVGGTPAFDTYGDVLEGLARDIGVSSNFTWIREGVPEEDLPGVYARADICVFPSKGYESLPTVIFEAMACGIPVVTTDRWGSPEALGEGHPGLVAEASPDAIAHAIAAIVGSDDLYQAVRHRQLQRIPRFALENTVTQHEDLYRAVARA
jgi:glycosyltransferase involved in cell wall biosynthesis